MDKPTTIEQILDQIERGLGDVKTAEALRDLTDDLFECPECRRLCENLHGQQQVCSICYIRTRTWAVQHE